MTRTKTNVYPKMTPEAFRDWRSYMSLVEGWTGKNCAEALGCGANQIYEWSDSVHAPPYIALACAALARGIEPWKVGYKFKDK